jgi:hypothetical protein
MQITIDLPQDLAQDLIHQAAQSNIPLQTLVLQALRQLVHPKIDTQWPTEILNYQGDRDFPAFESYRDELLPDSKKSRSSII